MILLEKQVIFLQALYLQCPMTCWLSESNSHIWNYFSTDLLKMRIPQHRNNTVAFVLINSASGGICQPPSPCFPSLVSLWSWNLHQAEYWKGAMFERTWGHAWNYRNRGEIDVRTTHSCRCRASCPFLCNSKGMHVPTSYQKVSVLPLASPVQQGSTNRSPWVLHEAHSCPTKMPFNTRTYGCNISVSISGYQLVSGWCREHCWQNKVGVSAVGVRRLDLTGLNMLSILLTFELARA